MAEKNTFRDCTYLQSAYKYYRKCPPGSLIICQILTKEVMAMMVYLILINMDFYNFTYPFSSRLWFRLRRYIKHSRQCLTNISKQLKVHQKYFTGRHIFNCLLNVRKCGQTWSFVFDILLNHLLHVLHWGPINEGLKPKRASKSKKKSSAVHSILVNSQHWKNKHNNVTGTFQSNLF